MYIDNYTFSTAGMNKLKITKHINTVWAERTVVER